MWFFMNSCYAFSVLSFLMLILTALQGYFHFTILHANHPTFALLTVIIYLFTQTLIIFFFVGTGVSIRDYTNEKKLNLTYRQRSLKVKRQIYPPTLLNMLFIMILFITGGAVDTGRLIPPIHGMLFLISIAHFSNVLLVQHQCFKEEIAIVLEMSGVKTHAPLS